MPTSPLPHKPVLSPAEPVRGFDAAADIARPSLRQLAPSLPGQGRTIAAKEAAPAGPRRETFAPWSAELAVAAALPISRVAPPSLGITAAAVGFGTLTSAAANESRSLGWSVGFVGENNAARWLDPFVSRQIDVGPVAPPRAFSESSSDFVEQFVDWNADNDNGSLVTDYIPAVRDYEVGFTPDENDVVPLTLVAVPPGGTYPGIVEHVRWRLQVSYTGTGRLRFWETPDKQNELTPSDDWQFTPHGDPRLQGQGRVPNVYLEGMEMSSEVRDITVTFSTLTFFEGMNAPVLQHFKQVKVAVTPVVKSFTVTGFVKPRYSNWRTVNSPWGDGSARWLQGEIYFKTTYIRPSEGEVYFVQNVRGWSMGLRGGIAAISRDPGTPNYKLFKWKLRPDLIKPQVPNANATFPVNDRPDNFGLNDPEPFYQATKRERMPGQDDGSWFMETYDHPRIRNRTGPEAFELIHFTWYFRTFVVWGKTERRQLIVMEIQEITWWMEFDFSAYSHERQRFLLNSSDGRASPAMKAQVKPELRRYYFNELARLERKQ